MYDLSDEAVVERWVENPYYQHFSGEVVFQWSFPCHPTDLVRFRHRLGEAVSGKDIGHVDFAAWQKGLGKRGGV